MARELRPITCNTSVTVTVSGNHDFHPFELDLTAATGPVRITMYGNFDIILGPFLTRVSALQYHTRAVSNTAPFCPCVLDANWRA